MEYGSIIGAFLAAFLVTDLELTEVVAIVYALGASSRDMRPAIHGAIAGVAVVGLIALGTGIALVSVARLITTVTFYLLIVSAVMLWGFGFFLLRSTVKTYFREAKKRIGKGEPPHSAEEEFGSKALFSGGFSVGAVETLEAVIVLLALTAGGYGPEALLGFGAGVILLVSLGIALHENIRKLKVPPLKWIGTTLLFTFAVFWSGEAISQRTSFAWPSVGPLPPDILLVPIFLVALLAVRGAVSLRVAGKLAALEQTRS